MIFGHVLFIAFCLFIVLLRVCKLIVFNFNQIYKTIKEGIAFNLHLWGFEKICL